MKISIPQGTRDLIAGEVRLKRDLQHTIMAVFASYCFEEVMTPAFEYIQTYKQAFSSLDEASLYKFFDENGEILALRMDMTVPIARLAATRFLLDSFPLRLCYSSNVYKVKKAFSKNRHEVMDCGVELIGKEKNADLEILCCAIDTLEATGLSDFILELNNAAIFDQLVKELHLSKEKAQKLSRLLDSKSLVDLEGFLKDLNLSDRQKDFILSLPFLSGGLEMLYQARKESEELFCTQMAKEIDALIELGKELNDLGYEDIIHYDLSKMPHQNYYTSLIFEGYAPGAAHSILSGGRYDNLLEKFGLDLPACGFSIKLDYLLELFKPEPVHYMKITYPASLKRQAHQIAKELRKTTPVLLEERDQENLILEGERKWL